ncbi:MAG: hypothetical protein Q8M22_04735 [Actinomycetota bacterium]|nr:hypothetical protein [Actinomycetota bacterium]
MSRRQRFAAVEVGVLEQIYENVVHLVSTPLTLEARCAALSMAHSRGFVTGPAGGRLTGIRRMPRTADVSYCLPHGAHVGPYPGVDLRQSTKIPPAHVVVRADGIRVASAARLAFDLASDLTEVDHQSVLEQLLNDGKCTMATLSAVGRQLAHPARPGSVRFMSNLLARSGRPTDSHPEVLVADGLRRRGVPILTQVEPLLLPGGGRITLDLAVPTVRWGVEIDVHPDHWLLPGTTRDKQRDRRCHLVGWQVERVTEVDLLDLEAICDELAELYRSRCELLGVAA